MKKTLYIYLVAIVAFLSIAAATYFALRHVTRHDEVAIVQEEQVDETPALVDSIRAIGEWQLTYLDIETQIDTVRSRWLGLVHDKVVRRYYGHVSLGIDMQKLSADWYYRHGDSISLTLPKVRILDQNFIDESRTKLVEADDDEFEQDPQTKQDMLDRAHRIMLQRASTHEVLSKAERQATNRLTRRFQNIGYKHVEVYFGDTSAAKE